MKCLLTISLCLLFVACEKTENPVIVEDERFITKLNMEQFQAKHLPDFNLVRQRGRREGREFVFDNINDTTNLFIRVGIFSSKDNAQNIAEEFHSWFSIIPQEDSAKFMGIGDKCWWMPDPFLPDTVGYHFIRYNSFILVNSHTYPNLQELTRAIDLDIVNNADYVEVTNTISLPKITSIDVTKQVLSEGDTTKITVHAIDPYNEALEFITTGLSNRNEDPENVFILKATRGYIPEPFVGKHLYEFTVINESNVVSNKAEIEIWIQ